MALRDPNKQKLSKSILEMKFMKRSKEKAQKEQDAEEGRAMFSDVITEDMKHGACKYIIEPSFVPCEDLIVGRLSYHGMNPEIERLLELEKGAICTRVEKRNEEEVSDHEMAHRYNTLVGTISRKFNTKREQRKVREPDVEQRKVREPDVEQRKVREPDAEPRKKKTKFLKPSYD